MIGWLQPAAFWGFGLLVIPIAIHLLRPRHARRVRFPTIRFVRPSHTAAIRLRPPSDLALLVLRLAIVALAVLAAAQPLWVSAARQSAWDNRTARAIVVDTSESMRTPRADDSRAADDATAVAEAEEADGLTLRIEDDDLIEGVRRAVAWLDGAPPARREIVIISDFQQGAISAASIEKIERDIGVRFVRVESGTQSRAVDGIPVMQRAGAPGRRQRIQLRPDGTEFRLEQGQGGQTVTPLQPRAGLRVVGAGEGDDERLRAALAEAGTPAPDPAQPLAFVFAGTPDVDASSFERWMLDTMAGIESDAELRALAREIQGRELGAPGAWPVLLEDRTGRPLVRAAAVDRELILECATPPATYFTAALVRTALEARYGSVRRPELEVVRIPGATLSAWSRSPGPADASAWRRSDESDARWLWVAALLLVGVETLLRSRTASRKDETRAAA